MHKKETVSQRNAVKANDFHDKNVHETSGGDENSESRKVQRLKRIENLANDPWFMFVGDSTTRHQWKTLLNTLRDQGYRVAASSVKWKKPADMGKKGVDPSKEALKNRKRDQDVILIDRKDYDNVLVLSLRFLVGNHVAKAAATCADFVLNHDYVEDRWPVPEFTAVNDANFEQQTTENEHFGLGDHEAKFATQARSLLRGRMPAGTQPSVIVLNSGLWELPSMIRERQSEFPLKMGGRRNRARIFNQNLRSTNPKCFTPVGCRNSCAYFRHPCAVFPTHFCGGPRLTRKRNTNQTASTSRDFTSTPCAKRGRTA